MLVKVSISIVRLRVGGDLGSSLASSWFLMTFQVRTVTQQGLWSSCCCRLQLVAIIELEISSSL